MNKLWLLLLFIATASWAIQGGIPANPQHPNQGQGNQGQGNQGQGNQEQTAGRSSAAAVRQRAQATAAAQIQTQTQDQAVSSANTQGAISLRGLLLDAGTTFDLWANATGSFNHKNVAIIQSGFDYRIKPRWLIGALANWAMAKEIKGSAMDGGLYTALSQWNAYLIASEVWHPDRETYITFGQFGYVAKIAQWIGGPFYAVQYSTRNDLIENQAGIWANRPLGRFSPEIQIMFENNCKRVHHEVRNFIWSGLTLNYKITDKVFLSAGYSIEANRHDQTNQVTLGFKAQW